MSDHGPGHEALLGAFLAEGREHEFRRRLGHCTRCVERWEALADVRGRLAEAAERRHAHLAEAALATHAPGEERLRETLERLAGEEPHRAPAAGPRRRLVLGAAAAAAAVLLGLWLAWPARPPEEPRRWLGDARLAPEHPVEAVESFAPFRWTYNGEAAAFALRVFRAPEGAPEELLIDVPTCKGTTWSPEKSSDLDARRIRWELDALDAFGNVLESRSASAWLSR